MDPQKGLVAATLNAGLASDLEAAQLQAPAAGLVTITAGQQLRSVWPVHLAGWLEQGWQLLSSDAAPPPAAGSSAGDEDGDEAPEDDRRVPPLAVGAAGGGRANPSSLVALQWIRL